MNTSAFLPLADDPDEVVGQIIDRLELIAEDGEPGIPVTIEDEGGDRFGSTGQAQGWHVIRIVVVVEPGR